MDNLENQVPAVENAVLDTATSGLTTGQKCAIGATAAALVLPLLVWGGIKLFNHVKAKRASKAASKPAEEQPENPENAN